jgi:hypothetical protein
MSCYFNALQQPSSVVGQTVIFSLSGSIAQMLKRSAARNSPVRGRKHHHKGQIV